MEKEFMDATSDNLVVIRDARHALLSITEPGEKMRVANSGFCRLLVTSIVTAIDAILDSWREKSRVLEPYFALPDNTPNIKRKESLQRAFVDHGIQIDESVLDDYLAIKFIRNASVHSRWKASEKEWVSSRNFTTDLNRFAMDDFSRFSVIYNRLAVCIFQTEFDDPSLRAVAPSIARIFAE